MPRILPGETDLYALTDSRLALGRSVEEQARALLSAGVKIVQYREKHAHAGRMLEECRLLRRLTQEAGATFIVNDHIDIAMLVDADGVHVGQDDLPVPEVRRLLGPDKIIGLSTHSPEQARAAVLAGADYIGVGPIFATQTKEDVCAPVGFSYLEWVVANISLPFVAIGGIKEHNIAEVAKRGATCCALVSELVGAPDIAAKVRAVRAAKLPDPKEIGNAGSFFKNPVAEKLLWHHILTEHPGIPSYPLGGGRRKLAAAWLIEAAGWKGAERGTVGVYKRHALILVNLGGATGEDVLRVAEDIRADVEERFGLRLELEPVVAGEKA